jgi:hypothetical protein
MISLSGATQDLDVGLSSPSLFQSVFSLHLAMKSLVIHSTPGSPYMAAVHCFYAQNYIQAVLLEADSYCFMHVIFLEWSYAFTIRLNTA